MNLVQRITLFFKDRQLLLMVIGAIAIAFLMTTISMYMYVMDDVSRLDVSLPNRENIRPAAVKEDMSMRFDASGELGEKDVAAFEKLFSNHRSALGTLGKFDGDSLSNDRLHIVGGE